ncbi:hypothetical protein [Sphingomonas sp.]|uniref:hypothetical protein n=1 Tax=Sphingomonas sp. TaxID=28214 RepID=UPI003B00641A
MIYASELEDRFSTYLSSGCDPAAGDALAAALKRAGLGRDARSLAAFARVGRATVDLSPDDWDGARAYAGLTPPHQAVPGDVWFDTVELAAMVLIPSRFTPDASRQQWLATRPVAVWQFRVFLALAQTTRDVTEFRVPADYLTADRFQRAASLDPATDVYQDEALAYSGWFGKVLAGRFDLQSARAFLAADDFRRMMPGLLRLWDGTPPPESEFTRVAVGEGELEHPYLADLELRERGVNYKVGRRHNLFEEWDRDRTIGFSTCVGRRSGVPKNPSVRTAFVTVRNPIRPGIATPC